MQTGTGDYTRSLRHAFDDLIRAYDQVYTRAENQRRALICAVSVAAVGWIVAAVLAVWRFAE